VSSSAASSSVESPPMMTESHSVSDDMLDANDRLVVRVLKKIDDGAKGKGLNELMGFLDRAVCDSADTQSVFDQAEESSNAGKKVCGYVFKDGDIAYYSKTYAADPTCIICSKCFEPELHKGTEYTMYPTAAGGVCDIGDPEAIDPVCWPKRYRDVLEGAVTDPVESLPTGMATRVDRILPEVIGELCRSANQLRRAYEIEDSLGRARTAMSLKHTSTDATAPSSANRAPASPRNSGGSSG